MSWFACPAKKQIIKARKRGEAVRGCSGREDIAEISFICLFILFYFMWLCNEGGLGKKYPRRSCTANSRDRRRMLLAQQQPGPALKVSGFFFVPTPNRAPVRGRSGSDRSWSRSGRARALGEGGVRVGAGPILFGSHLPPPISPYV